MTITPDDRKIRLSARDLLVLVGGVCAICTTVLGAWFGLDSRLMAMQTDVAAQLSAVSKHNDQQDAEIKEIRTDVREIERSVRMTR